MNNRLAVILLSATLLLYGCTMWRERPVSNFADATGGEGLERSFWKEVKSKNHLSGRKMSDAIFVARKASGALTIGDKKEIDKAIWRKPRGIRLAPTSRYVRDKLFPN